MTRADVVARLKAAESALRARGVVALYIYGSHARDEAREGSDIDILIDLDDSADIGLRGYMAPYILLEETFPESEIGYTTRRGIVPAYRPYIEQSAIRVF